MAIWHVADWLTKASANAFPLALDDKRAIICVNENNERIFPAHHSTPFLWCAYNDPGENLTLETLRCISEFGKVWKPRGLVVHCFAGRNRSTLACAWLLHTVDNMTVDDACRIMRTCQGENSNCGVRRELVARVLDFTGKDFSPLIDGCKNGEYP